MKTPPFETGEDVAIVSYFAPAEMQSMLALCWAINVSVIDLFAEFRCQTNGDPNVGRKSLVSALQFYGLEQFIPEEKDSMRDLILSGGPWSETPTLCNLGLLSAGCHCTWSFVRRDAEACTLVRAKV